MSQFPSYRNPVLDFCSIIQHGSEHSYLNFHDVKLMMISLAHEHQKKWNNYSSSIETSLFKC